MKKQYFFLFFLILCSSLLVGQADTKQNDSIFFLPHEKPLHTSYAQFIRIKDSFTSIEEKLEQAQRQIINRRTFTSYQDWGNHFSPLYNLGGITLPSLGFQSGNTSLLAYQKNIENQKFYKTTMPFTSFRYAQGGQQYIQFDALHTQNITKYFNIALGINSFTNKGLGLNQFQAHRSPFFNAHFRLPNNRYSIITSFTWVQRTGKTNGGISTLDSLVDVNNPTDPIAASDLYTLYGAGVNRNSLPTGLKNAFDSTKNTNHNLQFQYHFGNKYFDTLDSFYKVDPIFALGAHLQYRKERYLYADDNGDSAFYRHHLNKAAFQNNDSQQMLVLGAELNLRKLQKQVNGLGFGIKAGLQSYQYNQNELVNYKGINTYFGGDLETTIAKNVQLLADATVFTSGYNQGDYLLKGSAAFNIESFVAKAYFNSQLIEPAAMYKNFNSYYFNYSNNNLQKTLTNTLGLQLVLAKKHPLIMDAKVQNINNYIYFDTALEAKQLNAAFQLLHFSAAKHFQFRSVHAIVNAFVQNSSTFSAPLPNWGIKADLFYKHWLFDSAINLKTGLDIFTYGKHQALAYMPVLRQFYVNNMQKLGNYPLVDVYVSGEIKTLVFFAKMENVLGNITQIVPYSSQYFPYQPMAFRFGLLWDFYY